MKFKPLDGVDLKVAQTLRLGMSDGVFLNIEYIYGFEKFGAYETFRGGWRVTDPKVNDAHGRPLTAEAERLEDAIQKWATRREQALRILDFVNAEAK